MAVFISLLRLMMTTPLIQNGEPRYGRFKYAPSTINVQDYRLRSSFDQELKGIEAKLRYKLGFKSFQFIGINNQNVMIGLAIVDLGWVGNGFFYVYDKNRNTALELSELQPLARQTKIDHPAESAKSVFQKSKFKIEIQRANQKRSVKVTKGKQCLLDAVLDQSQVELLALCNPTGATGWTYTQKQTAQTVHGYYLQDGKRFDISPELGFLANTDDSCGFLSYQTSWHWLSLSATLQSGLRVGINFAMGVNQGFGTENAVWINDQIFEIPPVMFELIEQDKTSNQGIWRIYTADQSVNLRVKTGWCRQESLNFAVVASHFNQWMSEISGTITCDSQTIILSGEMGLLEKHFSKW